MNEKLNRLSFEDLARESLPISKDLLDRMKAISEKAEENIFKDACVLNKFPEDVLKGKPLFISCPCGKCTPYVM